MTSKLTLSDVRDMFDLKLFCAKGALINEIKGVYAGDLLSDVMSNAQPGFVWITIQAHPNIAAVAKLKRLCGIILVNGKEPDSMTIKKAKKENIPILSSQLTSFKLAGLLYEKGVTK